MPAGKTVHECKTNRLILLKQVSSQIARRYTKGAEFRLNPLNSELSKPTLEQGMWKEETENRKDDVDSTEPFFEDKWCYTKGLVSVKSLQQHEWVIKEKETRRAVLSCRLEDFLANPDLRPIKNLEWCARSCTIGCSTVKVPQKP